MLGSPVNVIAATQAEEAGVGHIGFFQWAWLGIPQLAGSIIIVLLLGKRLLPERRSQSIPADFSGHARTLAEHYRLEDSLHQLFVPGTSPLVGTARNALELGPYPGVRLVAFLDHADNQPLERDRLEAHDLTSPPATGPAYARRSTPAASPGITTARPRLPTLGGWTTPCRSGSAGTGRARTRSSRRWC